MFVVSAHTGLPTKDAPLTTIVGLLSGFGLTKLGQYNSSLTAFAFIILFINLIGNGPYLRQRPKYL